MTGHSDSTGACPAEEPKPDWNWLSSRVTTTAELDEWIAGDLAILEAKFAEFITVRSRARDNRCQYGRGRE
jgi:hypothetical protein